MKTVVQQDLMLFGTVLLVVFFIVLGFVLCSDNAKPLFDRPDIPNGYTLVEKGRCSRLSHD